MQIVHPEVPRERNIPCNICKKMYVSKIGLKAHLQRHERKKETEEEFRFIAEFFDMTCDRCDAVFTTYYEARTHYKESHNDEKGYVKCCGMKLIRTGQIRDHVKTHSNPDMFK